MLIGDDRQYIHEVRAALVLEKQPKPVPAGKRNDGVQFAGNSVAEQRAGVSQRPILELKRRCDGPVGVNGWPERRGGKAGQHHSETTKHETPPSIEPHPRVRGNIVARSCVKRVGMRPLLALAAALPLAAQVLPDVEFRLRLQDSRTRFRLGETISLELMFSSSSPEKYWLDTRMYDRIGRLHFTDEFLIEPVEGTSDPLQDYFPSPSGLGGAGGVVMLGQKPITLGRDLNEWVRFDRPGEYRIRVLSRRVSSKLARGASPTGAVELRSNAVEVTIVPANPEWQTAELRRAIEVLETVLPGPDSKTFERRRSAARTMRFLDTPAAVRQCVRWFRGAEMQLDYEFRFCLLGTTHRKLAAEAMERGLHDPSQPVSTSLVETLAQLRTWLELGAPGAYPKAEPAQARWREDQKRRYEHEMKTLAALTGQLAAATERKEGAAKAVSLRTLTDLLMAAKRDISEKLKDDLAASFAEMPWMLQSEMLGYRWEAVRTAAMAPALRRIIDDPPEGRRDLRDLALRRLYDFDPAEGRRLILAEIERAEPRLGFEVLAMLPEKTLPSLESTIMRNVERTRTWIGRALIARYGSKAILPRVKALYETIDKEMRSRPADAWRQTSPVRSLAAPACEPALIAYFLRVDPAYGEAKLRKAVAERWAEVSNCYMMIIPQTARLYGGPQWEKVAMEALEDPVVGVKMYAAKALGEHGSGAAKGPLFRTFEYWHEWWKDRPNELNAENLNFERELVRALAAGKGWKLDKSEFARLEGLCLTQECRNAARAYGRQAGVGR